MLVELATRAELTSSLHQVLAVEMDGEEGVKSERVTNFLTVPGEVEKVH